MSMLSSLAQSLLGSVESGGTALVERLRHHSDIKRPITLTAFEIRSLLEEIDSLGSTKNARDPFDAEPCLTVDDLKLFDLQVDPDTSEVSENAESGIVGDVDDEESVYDPFGASTEEEEEEPEAEQKPAMDSPRGFVKHAMDRMISGDPEKQADIIKRAFRQLQADGAVPPDDDGTPFGGEHESEVESEDEPEVEHEPEPAPVRPRREPPPRRESRPPQRRVVQEAVSQVTPEMIGTRLRGSRKALNEFREEAMDRVRKRRGYQPAPVDHTPSEAEFLSSIVPPAPTPP